MSRIVTFLGRESMNMTASATSFASMRLPDASASSSFALGQSLIRAVTTGPGATSPTRIVGQNRVNCTEDRVDIEIEHSIPRVRVSLNNLTADIGARIGVENVELSGLFEDRGHHALDTGRIQKVREERNRVLSEFHAQ